MHIVLLVVPLLAFIAWHHALRAVAKEMLLRTFLAALATLLQISSGMALLGWVGGLRPTIAVLVQVGLTGLVLLLARLYGSSTPSVPNQEPHTGFFAQARRGDLVTLGVVALLALPIVIRLLVYGAALSPYAFDELSYHLPPLVEALQHGRFVNSDAMVVYGNSYPKNVEMLFLWLMLGKDASLVLFGQILFLPVGILAVTLLIRRFGVPNPISLAGGLSVLFIPVVIVQSTTTYIDIATGCIFLASIALTFLYRDGTLRHPAGVIITFATLGFLAGTKYNGTALAVFCGVVAFLPDLLKRQLGIPHLLGLLAALPGISWYVGNLVWFHNPIWPFAVPGLDGVVPFTERMTDMIISNNAPQEFMNQSNWKTMWQVWREQKEAAILYTADSRFGGLGPLWFTLWLPAIPFWLFTERENRKRSVGLALFITLTFLTSTMNWWPRYTWWVTGLGIVAFFVLWHQMPKALKVPVSAVFVAGALFVTAATSAQFRWIWPNFARAWHGENAASIFLDPVIYDAYQRKNEVIAFASPPWEQFYVYGSDFSNRVVKVKAASRDGLLTAMRAADATYFLAYGGTDPTHHIVAEWPECFREVSKNEQTDKALYEFICR